MKRVYRSILAACLAACMMVTGIPFGTLQTRAEGEATVTDIYATFPQEGEPTDFVVDDGATDLTGKGLYVRIIRGGTYMLPAEDAEGRLPLYLDDATVTCASQYQGFSWDIRLAGNSSLNTGSYTISCNTNLSYVGNEITNETVNSVVGSYVALPTDRFTYTFTGDTTWSTWGKMGSLIVNGGVTLTIDDMLDGENVVPGTIEAASATISGTIVIEDSGEGNPSNTLRILENGILTVDTGTISGSGNASLELLDRTSITSETFQVYDRYNEETSQYELFTCDGTQGTECFFYDVEVGKWMRNGGSGGGPGLENNQYAVHYDDVRDEQDIPHAQVKLVDTLLGDTLLERDSVNPFTANQPLVFNLVKPEDRQADTPIVKIWVHSDPEEYYSSTDANDDAHKIILQNDSFTFRPTSEAPFEINVAWSEYDAFGSTDDKPVLIEMECTGDGSAEVQGIAPEDKIVNENWSKYRLSGSSITITWAGDAPREIRVDGMEPITNINGTSQTINLPSRNDNFYYIRVEFNEGAGGPGGGDPIDLKSYIEDMDFAFGDWDEDSDVDIEDLKLGMAYQIYYPRLNGPENQALREEYHIQDNDYINQLKNMIDLSTAPEQNISAKDATGGNRTIPAYSYTVNLIKGEDSTPIQATGTVYAFAFNDGSKYQRNNRGCVIAVAEKGDTKNYFLRCANAYTIGTTADTQKVVEGQNDGEASIVIVSEFDVVFNQQDSTYDRKVSIFGNGASLNALLSQEEDTDVVAYQGRNEMFMRDINKIDDVNWGCIFSVFSFYQESFKGVQVQGSGASGNTPSWAFNQYPVFSTDDEATTEKEAVVYFGNSDVTIKPIDQLTELDATVAGIASVELADQDIPTAAVNITMQSAREWKITFLSDFYDQVKVKIVYALQGGSTKTSYLNIHRVGLDILTGNGGGAGTLFHGTENGPTYNATGERVIWATYYYPEATDNAVDLYVTYTWPNGTITKDTIHNDPALNLDYHHDGTSDCKSSDFVLYDGTEAGAPTKVEAIAVVSGFDNTTSTTFSGAKFGAGKGVVWNNYLGTN